MSNMSIKEAIYILDPETSSDAIEEIKYYAGFNQDKVIEKINEACVTACSVMISFEKLKIPYEKMCERCDRLEKENIELTDLDKLIEEL